MEKIILDLPTMYADHHVLRVRQALTDLDGVKDVVASALYRDVVVEYDPQKLTPDAIQKTLEAAGYPVGREPKLMPLPPAIDDSSPWFQVVPRVTQTNMLDLEMSGDFRKY